MIVYALVDPRDGQPFYVGKSMRGWDKAERHTRPSSLDHSAKSARIRALQQSGLTPQVWPIAWARDAAELATLETTIIRQWYASGLPILNRASLGKRRSAA